MKLSHAALSRIYGALTIALVLVTAGLAAACMREAVSFLDLRTRRATFTVETKSPSPNASRDRLKVIVADAPGRLPARVTELLNASFSELGFSVQGVRVVARRPLVTGIDALTIEVRARGRAASALDAARWMEANASVMAAETVTASPAVGSQAGEADWTYQAIVLAGVRR